MPSICRLLHPRVLATFVLLLTFPLGGCLFRSHRVERPVNLAALKTSNKAELINYINSEAAKIQSMQATVDIDTSVGGAKKGKITEYQQIRGYVLARKPAMLRMIGLLPIIRNTAFDMVSDGQEFKVSIPPKNRFVMGRNNVITPNPRQPLENLRPQVIYDALLLREIDLQNEVAIFENGTETITGDKGKRFEMPNYVIDIIRTHGGDGWLSRKIIFSRKDLLPQRQLVYDESGTLVTDAQYSDYKDYDAVLFPSRIEIRRPEEEYDITLTMLKLQINKPLDNTKFALEPQPGEQIIHLDRQQPTTRSGETNKEGLGPGT
jgi:outer membrane lipoprotein-sorting protein